MMRQQDKPIAAGMVRGPGTATSDNVQGHLPQGSFVMPADSTQALGLHAPQVPVAVSPGEQVMHPKHVHAFGLRALQALKNATHTPVQQPASDGRRLFFANGGVVDEKDRLREAAIASIPNYVARRDAPQQASQAAAQQAASAPQQAIAPNSGGVQFDPATNTARPRVQPQQVAMPDASEILSLPRLRQDSASHSLPILYYLWLLPTRMRRYSGTPDATLPSNGLG